MDVLAHYLEKCSILVLKGVMHVIKGYPLLGLIGGTVLTIVCVKALSYPDSSYIGFIVMTLDI